MAGNAEGAGRPYVPSIPRREAVGPRRAEPTDRSDTKPRWTSGAGRSDGAGWAPAAETVGAHIYQSPTSHGMRSSGGERVRAAATQAAGVISFGCHCAGWSSHTL